MNNRLGIAIVALLAGPTAATAAEPAFQDWLALLGWNAEAFASAAAESPRSPATEAELLNLAERFGRLPGALVEVATATGNGGSPSPSAGSVVRLAGRVVAARRRDDGAAELTLSVNGVAVTVLSVAAPRAWTDRPPVGLDEPAELRGIAIAWGAGRRLVVTPRVAWRPRSAESDRVSLGAALLGRAGMDLGLLDLLADGKPLASQEAEPFYQTLSACQDYGPRPLLRAAGENLPRYARRWRERPPEKGPPPLLSAEVGKRAVAGRYSVAPFFNDAENQRGELAAFEGTVRRAVRIDLTIGNDGQPSRAPTRHGLDHYYELEVFPDDSQNLPLVFCVLRLPEGFPVGDAVRERARLAGFFLKRWAYRTRKPDGKGGDRRQLAPLFVGPGPVWLPGREPERPGYAGWLAGAGFVGVVAIVTVALWRQSQGDRRFGRAVVDRYTRGPAPPPREEG